MADRVELNDKDNSAVAIVPDRQLSLAIGREGQNARLAAKLTNWRIDIQGATQLAEDAAPAEPAAEAEAEAAAAAEPEVEAPVVAQAEEVAAAADAAAPEVAAPEAEVSEEEAAPAVAEETAAEEVAEPEAEVTAEASVGEAVVSEPATDQELELLALEEELAALEREEAGRKEAERIEAAALVDVSSDDLWQVDTPGGESEKEEAGAIRFAEDIAGFRELGPRRRRGGGGRARRRR